MGYRASKVLIAAPSGTYKFEIGEVENDRVIDFISLPTDQGIATVDLLDGNGDYIRTFAGCPYEATFSFYEDDEVTDTPATNMEA